MKYYKNKYIIGIYTNDIYETCLTIVDNKKEFAELMGISINIAAITLSKAFNKKLNYIIYAGKRAKIEFVKYEEE